MAQHFFGNTPEEKVLQPSQTLRTHDDQVGILLLRDFKKTGNGLLRTYLGDRPPTVRGERGNKEFQPLVRLFLLVPYQPLNLLVQ